MASWYERKVVPQIIKLGCGCVAFEDYRRQCAPKAHGRVLELGVGAGANLKFYDADKVSHLVAIEPSPELRAIAAKAERAPNLPLEIIDAAGEELPFPAESFDAVVCTFTLCTVQDPVQTLAEARRVLKPGGRFLFCEHGRSPDADVLKWQERIDPVWTRLFGGCHITRPVRGNVERAFAIQSWKGAYHEKGPRFASWMEMGEAVAQ
jgi:ubiquinone/menaquinone biosynthesis C-methylase UbiE